MAQTASANLGWQNRFSTTLSSGITASDTTIPLNALPTPTEGFLVIEPDSSTAWEVIFYTSKTGSAVVCTSAANGRGVDDSTAQSHSSGAVVRMDTTAGMFEVLQNGSAMNAGALGGSPFATGWINAVLPSVSSVTNNGNRSYDVTFASTVASYLTPGMRLRTSRTVAAPTYMGGALNGSSHYFVKATPSGTLGTVTNNFTIGGTAEPTAYGTAMCLAGRVDAAGNNGIILQQDTTGQIMIWIINGGGANFRKISTYRSVPLNKKTHVVATWTGGTAVIYFDGISVPVATAVTGGTAPTTAGTGGDFAIGRYGANAGGYYTGYLSGFGVFDAVLTAATIKSYSSQVLSGSETNCIGAWSLNNTANDQNAAANNLTATGGVSYTSGKAPYATDATGTATGTYDYAIVTKVATTVATVQVPEGCAIPTSGGVSTVDLGTGNPFGFPKQEGRWRIEYYQIARSSTTGATGNNWYNAGDKINIPVGSWMVALSGAFQATYGATTGGALESSLSTATTSESDKRFTRRAAFTQPSSTQVDGSTHAENQIDLTVATDYYPILSSAISTSVLYFGNTRSPMVIYAKPSHL